MGARTPHELMRCAEVTFIRDCAELAARASLARTESRWGLYHDRADLPERDDDAVVLAPEHPPRRRRAPRAPQARRSAPTSCRSASSTSPPGIPARWSSSPGRRAPSPAGPASRARPAGAAAATTTGRPPEILELLRLAETQPSVAQLEPYLTDSDARVRRAAIAALTETVPPGAGRALAQAAGDEAGPVRHAAVAGLRELVAILPADDGALLDSLRPRAGQSPTRWSGPRSSIVLSELRVGRRRAVRGRRCPTPTTGSGSAPSAGLSPPDRPAWWPRAAADRSREVRVAVADGLAALAAELTGPGPGPGPGPAPPTPARRWNDWPATPTSWSGRPPSRPPARSAALIRWTPWPPAP